MINERVLTANLNAFVKCNTQRIDKALQIAPAASGIGLLVIPVLFENNHKELPGFVDGAKKQSVIPFLEVTEQMKNAGEAVIRHFKQVLSEIDGSSAADPMAIYGGGAGGIVSKTLIHSLFIMGSVGTAAQNEKSDFDYWVVYDKTKLEKEEIDFLKEKIRLLEQWGDKKGVELHFFLTDVNDARNNIYGSADEESAGTSQASLLKEEFYRTALLVAGRYPVWWATPPSITDKQYAEAMEVLSGSAQLDPTRFVNLGNIESIPISELFGAALWQMNKAIDSPYKSVLKMGMLEELIFSKKSTLLCEELKEKAIASNGEPNPDPYLILIERLLGYYNGRKRDDVTDLLKKCFYNKVHIKINDKTVKKSKLSYKEELMIKYTADWGWDSRMVDDMNGYDDWPFDRMLKLGNELHKFLLETYRNLTDNLKKQKQSDKLISKEDLTVLGNKLFAFYNVKKKGKVELIRRATDTALRQESATFNPIITRGKKTIWAVLKGNVTTLIARKEVVAHAEIKRNYNLTELVVWLWINKVIDLKSFLHLVSSPLPVSLQEIQGLMKAISEFMPFQSIASIDSGLLLHRPKTVKLMVIANFNSQAWAKKVEEVTILYKNSHGETFVETLEGKAGLQRAAVVYGTALGEGIEHQQNFFTVYIPRAENSLKLEKQIRSFLLSASQSVKTAKES